MLSFLLLPIFANIAFYTAFAQIIQTAPNVGKDIADHIFIYYIKGPGELERTKINLENGLTLVEQPNFNSKLETVFYFHGWGASGSSSSVKSIATAFLATKKQNIVVFDYADLVNSEAKPAIKKPFKYLSSVRRVNSIGTEIGLFLQKFCSKVQSENLIHLLSHSLGSQVMSHVAKTFGSGRLWLTALDPAGPIFNIPPISHLTASDGSFVDVIHTNGGAYGDGRKIGTIDIYPNGGKIQPGCSFYKIRCNHKRSWEIYAEAIRNPHAFPAKKCTPTLMAKWSNYHCNNSNIIYIGLNIDKSASGQYYLKINSSPPYGLGEEGLNF